MRKTMYLVIQLDLQHAMTYRALRHAMPLQQTARSTGNTDSSQEVFVPSQFYQIPLIQLQNTVVLFYKVTQTPYNFKNHLQEPVNAFSAVHNITHPLTAMAAQEQYRTTKLICCCSRALTTLLSLYHYRVWIIRLEFSLIYMYLFLKYLTELV